jgi:hypothetical protein
MTTSKSIKRFTYHLTQDSSSHKKGANTLTIKDNVGKDNAHDTGTKGTSTFGTTMTMTVREAKALQKFLNENIGHWVEIEKY